MTQGPVDRILDTANRQPEDMDGIFIAYMDGCESDIIGDADSRAWYTVVAIAAPNQSRELREKEAEQPFFGDTLGLQKWSNSTNTSAYRQAAGVHLVEAVHAGRLIVRAASYMHRTAQRAYPELVRQFYGGDPPPEHFQETADQNGRQMITFPSLLDGKGKPMRIQRKVWISLAMIAENLSNLYHAVEASSIRVGDPLRGALVLSDKISGDNKDGAPKVTVLNKMLESWHQDKIRVASYENAEAHCGEFIADNLAGMLNNTANDANDPCRRWVKKLMREDALKWVHFGATHRSKPMRLSGR